MTTIGTTSVGTVQGAIDTFVQDKKRQPTYKSS